MDYYFSKRISSLQPSAIREILKATQDPSIIPFAAGNPDASSFPVDAIKKISIKQGLLFRSSFHIHIVADKKYHLKINAIKDFSSKLTGSCIDNVKNFVDTLRASVENYE